MTDLLDRVFGPEEDSWLMIWDQLEPNHHITTLCGMAKGTARGLIALMMYSWFIGTAKRPTENMIIFPVVDDWDAVC